MKWHRLARGSLFLGVVILAAFAGAKINAYLSRPPAVDLSDAQFPFWHQEVDDMPVVEIFYVTNRELVPGKTDEFSDKAGDSLSYGMAEVRMPAGLLIGDVQLPEIPRKVISNQYAVILSIKPLSEDDFLAALAARLTKADPQISNLFVHGIGHSFDSAVRQAGALSFDLDLPQPMVVFAWPTSAGRMPAPYERDRTQVDGSARQLTNFLEALQKSIHPKELNIIAHSLGCKVACKTFANLVPEEAWNESETKIANIVLAAPDVDREDFDSTFVKDMATISDRVTVYVSRNDGILAISTFLNGDSRAGDSDHVPLQDILKADAAGASPIQIVDATFVNTFATAHSSFYQNRSVFFDLHNLLYNNRRAEDRHLLRHEEAGKANYWILRP